MIPSQLLGIDITDWIIAMFTGVLAVLNGFLVYYNWRLSRATKIAAGAAKEAADAAKKQANFTEKALVASESPDVYVGEINAVINERGTWVVTTEIRSDRVTEVISVHFNFRVEGSLKKRVVPGGFVERFPHIDHTPQLLETPASLRTSRSSRSS